MGWGEGLAGKVLIAESQGPECEPQHSHKKPDVTAHSRDHDTGEEEPGNSLAGQPGLVNKFQAGERPCHKE